MSEEEGLNPTANASEIGGTPSDIYHPGLDYGNVIYTRRHRFMASFLYDLPFGRSKMFLSNSSYLVNSIVNDWQLAGYYLQQSGPFLTPITSAVDPTGTGMISKGFRVLCTPRQGAGRISLHERAGVTQLSEQSRFRKPGSEYRASGNCGSGERSGLWHQYVFDLFDEERGLYRTGKASGRAQVQNLLNHHNYDIPASLDIATPNFGQITSVQTKDNAGPRAVALTARLSF